jgi:hypothetical protein
MGSLRYFTAGYGPVESFLVTGWKRWFDVTEKKAIPRGAWDENQQVPIDFSGVEGYNEPARRVTNNQHQC